ncbi:MAG: hypothetical protein JW827_06755 [Spirochaetes bacterium]|nr:hypothetical protein [Spirochaetota bacterium]
MKNKSVLALLVFLFILIWIIAIFIGYQKGKKIAKDDARTLYESYDLEEKKDSSDILQKSIMKAIPLPFEPSFERFTPVDYIYRISMKDRLKIIDEEGNVIKSSSPAADFYNLFAYRIIDTDIKTEDELKEKVKFQLEAQAEEEYYPGIMEEPMAESVSNIKKGPAVLQTNM